MNLSFNNTKVGEENEIQKKNISLFLCIFLCLFLIADVSFAQTEDQNENESAEITAEDDLTSEIEDTDQTAPEENDDSENFSISDDIEEDAADNDKQPAAEIEELQIEQSEVLEAPKQTANYSVSAASVATAPQPTVAPKAAARAATPSTTQNSASTASASKTASSTNTGVKSGYITARAANSSQNTFYVSLTNATIPNGCTVKMAIWSDKNGQDDLVWYPAVKSGNSYTAVVPISSHKSTGTYSVHAYYQTPQGQMNGLCIGSFTVSAPTARDVSFSRIDNIVEQVKK